MENIRSTHSPAMGRFFFHGPQRLLCWLSAAEAVLAGERDGIAVVVEEPVGCASIPLFHSMPGLMMWLSAQAAQAARITAVTAGKPGRIPRSLELLPLAVAVAMVTHILVAMEVLAVEQIQVSLVLVETRHRETLAARPDMAMQAGTDTLMGWAATMAAAVVEPVVPVKTIRHRIGAVLADLIPSPGQR